MSDDEQGYAPAVYLEPMENNAEKDVHPEDSIDEGMISIVYIIVMNMREMREVRECE